MSVGIIKKEISADLVGGDLDFDILKRTNNTYNIRPLKIMVDDTVDSVLAVVGALQQENNTLTPETYHLKSNTEYDLAFRKIIKAGTTTKKIFIIGEAI
jgi:hypothetical protein